MSTQPPQKAPRNPGRRAASFLGWAFAISLLLHLIVLPFFHGGKEVSQEKEKTQKITSDVPTPKPTQKPTPKPTPTPPPTPPPKKTPPPPKQTPPPVEHKPPPPKLKVNPPKTTSKSVTGPSENKYDVKQGNENGVPQGVATSNGTQNTAAPGPVKTGVPATPAPTPVPATPTPKPTPACAKPNVDAAVRGTPADAEYPDIAREQGIVGTTQVKVTLSATGTVVSATVFKSAGNQALDQSAIAAAKATSYTPDIVNCVPTAGSYIFSAAFTSQ